MLEQYSMAKYFTYLETMVIPLVPGRGKIFRVTPKAREAVGSAGLVLPQLAVLLASVAATIWALVALLLGRRSDGFVVAVNSFWALYNSGLAATIVGFGTSKIRQRRGEFRIPETVVASWRPAGDGGGAERFGVVEDLTPDGAALLSVGDVPDGGRIDVFPRLVRETVRLRCEVVRRRSVTAGRREVSQLGLRFVDVPHDVKDVLARYLHEAAVSRFMEEHALGYRTWLDRRLSGHDEKALRASRSLAYLPALVREPGGEASAAAVKDLSATGLLLVTARERSPGDRLAVEVVLGDERIPLSGQVVRSLVEPGEDYPEYLAGVRLDGECAAEALALTEVAGKIDELVNGEARTD
jgi:hypothetical protein